MAGRNSDPVLEQIVTKMKRELQFSTGMDDATAEASISAPHKSLGSRFGEQEAVANKLLHPTAPFTFRNVSNTSRSALPLTRIGGGDCICFRPLQLVLCQLCGETFPARVRRVCTLHPRHIYLQDVEACMGCKQNNTEALKEFELPSGKTEIGCKNVRVKKIRWIGRD
eukprot:GFUD01026895.1.p1 GENE.GFUD01026895.1~~GFUD01026895.1.p1  ORF type:complete len:168 (-),score=42.18 GFUD01026895.1:252-755(-)